MSACRHSPRTRAAVSATLLSASCAQRHVCGLVAVVRILIAMPSPRMTSRRRVRDVRVGVTLSRQARRHVHDLIAFVRILIAVACPRMTLCRRVATPRRTRAAVSVTCVSVSRAQRHVRDLIAFVRNLIAALRLRITSRRRVAAPRAPAPSRP